MKDFLKVNLEVDEIESTLDLFGIEKESDK